MIKSVWEWILQLFGVKTQSKNYDIQKNDEYVEEYRRIDDINFSAIFGNKLANYVINDSTFEILKNNKRAQLFNDKAKSFWKKAKKTVATVFGAGGVVLVPYVKNGKLYYSIVEQNRMTIDDTEGGLITGATILSELKTISNLSATHIYYRWTNYKIENNNLIVTQKFTIDGNKEIDAPNFWSNITEQFAITNVDRVPFGFIKSPVNNRRTDDKYGVPITYGCEKTIAEIKIALKQIADEFKLKEAWIGLDQKLIKKDKNGKDILPSTKLFKKMNTNQEDFFEIFNPDIRESSFYARLQELYMRLEKEIGTSKGILSDPQTQNATATEIKRSMYDTFTIVDDMRSNMEEALNDFFKGCEVLCNALNIVPQGEYELKFDWDYSLLEDSQEQFNQMTKGVELNVIDDVELRNWLKPNETMKESEKAIEKIKEKSFNKLTTIADMLNDEIIDKEKAIDLLFDNSITPQEKARILANNGDVSFEDETDENNKEGVKNIPAKE